MVEVEITIEQIKACNTVGEVKDLISRWSEASVVVSRKEKPNSFEIGKAGNRFNICFDTPADLDEQIKSLKALGYMQDAEI